MKKAVCITALLGIMMLPCAIFAQTTPTQTPAVPEATASTVPADQQPTKEQLNKLFELMNVRGQLASLSKMMPGLLQQQMQQMQKDHPEMATMSEEQQKEADKIMNKFMGRVFDVYNADDMIADMASIYQRHLTRSDVDGIIAFYSSPAGQHMIAMVPVIMQEYMPLAMQRMQDRMKPLIDQMGKEMEAIGKPVAPPADKPAAK
ncbi:MAG: DUF2059 domain-containing protein [Terracidiphilus sp.]